MKTRALLQQIFLGSSATFRNQNRNWLYLGFIGAVVMLIALARSRGNVP